MTPPYDLRIRPSRDSEFHVDMIWLKEYNDVSYKQPTNTACKVPTNVVDI